MCSTSSQAVNNQLSLFETPAGRSRFGVPASMERAALLAKSPEFCATVMAVFERHPGEWSSKFNRELWSVFRAAQIGSQFALTMRTIGTLVERRDEYFGSKAIGPDYVGFTSAYRLAGTGDGNVEDLEYTSKKPTAERTRQRTMKL